MKEVAVTLTLSERLYHQTLRLVDEGLFTSFDEVVRSGLRSELYRCAVLPGDGDEEPPPGLSAGEQWAFYARRLSDRIKEMGGLGLGDTPDQVLETLRQARQQLWKEKYAAYFGRQ